MGGTRSTGVGEGVIEEGIVPDVGPKFKHDEKRKRKETFAADYMSLPDGTGLANI
jgi:hypothetical protein